MNRFVLIFTFFLVCKFLTFGQTQTVKEQHLDTVFKPWDNLEKPGLAAGFVLKGKPIYVKGFGLANLEHKVPIGVTTKFQIDDLSKQFTALALLVLEQEGKVSLRDDVRKYIPELPEYTNVLTINHLLNHTSGLNDYSPLHSLKRTSEKDRFTQADAITLIATQQELNFPPGTDFSYFTSDTETTLMAEIIAKASGQSFASFLKTAVFEPLGMENTMVRDDSEMLVSDIAEAYSQEEGIYKKNALGVATFGSTNVYTCAKDLSLFYTYFGNNKNPMATLINALDKPVQLNSGKTYDSSWGKMTIGRYFGHKERGAFAYWHFGLAGSYGANVFRFPEQELVSFVIGNNGQYNGRPAMQAAEQVMKDHYPEPSTVDFTKIKTVKLNNSRLKKFEGAYWNAKRGIARTIILKNDSLRYCRPGSDYQNPLVSLSKTKFQMVVESDDVITLDFNFDGNSKSFAVISGGSDPALYESYTPAKHDKNSLEQFNGEYYCKSIGVGYHFEIKEEGLSLLDKRGNEIVFRPVMEAVFISDNLALGSIEFTRNSNGAVEGFTITTDGINKLFFTKN